MDRCLASASFFRSEMIRSLARATAVESNMEERLLSQSERIWERKRDSSVEICVRKDVWLFWNFSVCVAEDCFRRLISGSS